MSEKTPLVDHLRRVPRAERPHSAPTRASRGGPCGRAPPGGGGGERLTPAATGPWVPGAGSRAGITEQKHGTESHEAMRGFGLLMPRLFFLTSQSHPCGHLHAKTHGASFSRKGAFQIQTLPLRTGGKSRTERGWCPEI